MKAKSKVAADGENVPFLFQGVSQKLAYTGTTAQSAAVGANTQLLRLVATSNCHVLVGSNPTAVADGTCLYLPLGIPQYVGCTPGDKVAAIQDSAGGNLFITEGV